MTRVPALAAIEAVESRLIQSKRNVRQSVVRTRSALRAAIARPSTLVLVAVASGISTFLVVHRPRCTAKSPNRADSSIKVAKPRLVRKMDSLFGPRMLTWVLQFVAARK